MTESFQQLFEQSLASQQIKPGPILTGIVVDMSDDVVIVNAGLKSEAVIPIEQFRNESGRDRSRRSATRSRSRWMPSRTASARPPVAREGQARPHLDAPRRGLHQGRDRQGHHQRPGQGRLHRRHRRRPRLPARFAGRRAPGARPELPRGQGTRVQGHQARPQRNNVVVSRRAVVEQEYSAEREQLLENLQEGDVVKGVVKNLTDYGAFVDLGGIDGLLHITDMAWKRVRHPSEVVKVGDELDVRILKFDRERNRVSLGLKQLGEDPWENIARRYPPNTRLFGKVTNVTDYGCFVEIEPGVEGLVHVSEMDWTNKNVNPSKVVQVGDEVEVMVLDIDEERRRISLGIKQCKPNPWREFADSFNKRRQGLAARSSRSPTSASSSAWTAASTAWCTCPTSPGTAPAKRRVRNYKKGETMEAMVLSIDPERERISLGVKQLEQGPDRGLPWPTTRRAASSRAPSRKWTRAARPSTSATASRAACAPPRSRASASRTRARCSRSATRSRRRFMGMDRKGRAMSAVDPRDRGRGGSRGGAAVPRLRFGDRHVARRPAEGADLRSVSRSGSPPGMAAATRS